jgi:hypothetical protein
MCIPCIIAKSMIVLNKTFKIPSKILKHNQSSSNNSRQSSYFASVSCIMVHLPGDENGKEQSLMSLMSPNPSLVFVLFLHLDQFHFLCMHMRQQRSFLTSALHNCNTSTAGIHLNSFLHWTFTTFQAVLLHLQDLILYCQKYDLERLCKF